MTFPIDISRRSFLVHASRGTVALAILGVAGCGPTALSSAGPSDGSSASIGAGGSPSAAGGAVTWQRANLGFVSAYVLARAGEAAIVDTGLPGSEGTIHEALMA